MIQTGKQGQQGSFAGTRWAHNGHGLTTFDLQVNAVEYGQWSLRAANLLA
jgi:hypothetical protein